MSPSTPDTPTGEPKPAALHIGGRLLARNTAINLVGRIVPLLVGIVAMPYVIRHLGPDRFGLLSLAWMVVGYFALFNLGIGPATTKFVAELLGRGEREKLPDLVWTALISQTCLGVVGGVLLWASTPLLVDRLLKIPPDLHAQAHLIFLILAFALPIDFAGGSVSGVLGASQRFDLLNLVGIPSSALTYLLPVVALWLGYGLPLIVLFLVIARIAAFFVVVSFCLRLYPDLRSGVHFNPHLVRKLLGFGGWVTVTSVIGPILLYTDRFLIGGLVSLAAVGYYSLAFKSTAFLQFIPVALAGTLLPAFSSLQGATDSARTARLFLKSYKYIFLVTTPILICLIVFAKNIFGLWVGPSFAAHVVLPFQILAVGMAVALLGPIANALLRGMGRPDIVGWIYVAHLPINTLLVWFMVTHWGILGAALSATIRSFLDAALLFYFSSRLVGVRIPKLIRGGALPILGAVGFSGLLLAVGWFSAGEPIGLKAPLFAATMSAYGFVTLKFALDASERRRLWGVLAGGWIGFARG